MAGRPVGVHVCRALSDMGPSQHSLLPPPTSPNISPPTDESSSLAQLMALVLGQEDKPAAIAAAMRAIQAQFVPPTPSLAAAPVGTANGSPGGSGSRLDTPRNASGPPQTAAAGPAARKAAAAAATAPAGSKEAGGVAGKPEERNGGKKQLAAAAAAAALETAGPGAVAKSAGGGKAKKGHAEVTVTAAGVVPEVAVEDVTKFLDDFPATKRMLERFHAVPATENKSALSLVHEYAARLALEVGQAQTSIHNEMCVYAWLSVCLGGILQRSIFGGQSMRLCCD